MAFLNVNTPLKNLKTGDYFYPLTNLDQIITGNNRLSAFMSEDNNLLNLSNIGNLSVNGNITINGNLTGNNGIFSNRLTIGSSTLNTDYVLYVNGFSHLNGTTNSLAYTLNGATSAGTNYITGSAGRIFFGGNFHIDSLGSNKTYINYYTANDVIMVSGSSQGKVGIGTASPSQKLHVSGGVIAITNNGNTLTIGSLNTSCCHFENSVDIPFYFSHQVLINGNLLPYTNNNRLLGDSSHYWNGCYASNFYGTLNGSATGVYTTSASGDNIAALKSVWNNLPANETLGVYLAHGSASFFIGWRLAGYAVGNAYGGGIIDNYGNPDYVNISNGTFTAKHIWLRGDAVTSAVWNDYAENRCASVEVNFGQVLMEVGDDTLVPTTERLSHFAGIASDTWGFSQGETETAKTPIAVAGRVLAYPYRDRNEYKPGDCLCAAPNGTVDIMTREEIYKYPDRIVGTVSCVPIYEEWGGGKDADRKPVKVNGRIWVRVR